MSEPLLSTSLASSESIPRFRAGAVAHMVRMPVATLRIWEQRYQLSKEVSGSGHRLYSASDVQRIALLKQLSDLGHAIGTIAALDMEQLRQVVVTHVSTIAGPLERSATPAALLGRVSASGLASDAVPPRRYDDATLTHFAARSSTVDCECPRHVVALLMQLSHFEAYSAECEKLSPADVALHACLCQATAAARHLFEVALERLAIHEGILLVASGPDGRRDAVPIHTAGTP